MVDSLDILIIVAHHLIKRNVHLNLAQYSFLAGKPGKKAPLLHDLRVPIVLHPGKWKKKTSFSHNPNPKLYDSSQIFCVMPEISSEQIVAGWAC